MADTTEIVKSIIAGLLTGGASTVTTVLAVFRDVKKRVGVLEEKVGSASGDVKTGLFLAVATLEEGFRKLRKDIEGWEDEPPLWVSRTLTRARQASGSWISAEYQQSFEERLENRLRTFQQLIRRVEEDRDDANQRLRKLEDQVGNHIEGEDISSMYVTRKDYNDDSRDRAKEISRIREHIVSIGGLLRGVMAALGYIDDKSGGV